MTAAAPSFRIVRTVAGYHVRLVGRNGSIVFQTEPYAEARRARRAIEIAAEACAAGAMGAGALPAMSAGSVLVQDQR